MCAYDMSMGHPVCVEQAHEYGRTCHPADAVNQSHRFALCLCIGSASLTLRMLLAALLVSFPLRDMPHSSRRAAE